MYRARFSLAATLGVLALSTAAFAQAPPAAAPPMKSVLAGKKLTPPAKGEVTVEYVSPQRKRVGEQIQTTFQVKNINVAPIARFTITQTWFDKSGNVVGGGKGEIAGLFQPGDVQTIVITSEAKPSYNSDSFNFGHANGTIKAKAVPKVTKSAGAPADAKPAAADPKKSS
ncbi:MAG TPA: hypothetical protein VJP86_08865 [Vicinamibacterales bacterium]|jgi:hypothetical protein|nr:hypothetical protein [Vicinamibacterales bacterium]